MRVACVTFHDAAQPCLQHLASYSTHHGQGAYSRVFLRFAPAPFLVRRDLGRPLVVSLPSLRPAHPHPPICPHHSVQRRPRRILAHPNFEAVFAAHFPPLHTSDCHERALAHRRMANARVRRLPLPWSFDRWVLTDARQCCRNISTASVASCCGLMAFVVLRNLRLSYTARILFSRICASTASASELQYSPLRRFIVFTNCLSARRCSCLLA